jgi:non-ribosomal peptide synthetase component F
VLAYLRHVAGRYAPHEEDRFSQLSDLTFDLSVHDMFLCWGAGAALYCPPDRVRIAPRDFVRKHALTFWFSVPSTAAFMSRLHALRPGDFPSLRWSLFCGEALPKRLALAFAAAAPNAVLENLYGPTETTIAVTAYRLRTEPDERERAPDILPIGAPFPGQRMRVVDESGQAVAEGEPGELCICGSQVADGYWRLPERTAERFMSLPGTPPECRWYRTGDRAVITACGLELFGRLDRQIKVGGHRVELQEVEAALQRAAGCDTAAAVAWPVDADGLVRGIVAFVSSESVPIADIEESLRRLLPPYMMPSSVHRLADWPLNDNGKTDYRRLKSLVGS